MSWQEILKEYGIPGTISIMAASVIGWILGKKKTDAETIKANADAYKTRIEGDYLRNTQLKEIYKELEEMRAENHRLVLTATGERG